MVKNKLLYATIAAMLMGAVFTGCSNTDNNNTTTRALWHSRNLPQVRIQIYQSN